MKTENQGRLISAIFTVLAGILFIILKGEVISIAMTVFGVALIVSAIVDIVHKRIFGCIFKAVLGVLIIVFGWAFVKVALYVLAVILLVFGIVQIIGNFRTKAPKNVLVNILRFVQPVICIIAGACLFFYQGATIEWVFILSGVLLIVQGALALIVCIFNRK